MNHTMIIDTNDYNMIQNNIPVLTRTGDGKYINTNCYLSNFYIESKNVKNEENSSTFNFVYLNEKKTK